MLSLSYYDYSTYKSCPRKYYYDQTKPRPQKDNRTSISGIVVQKALEIYIKSGAFKEPVFNTQWFSKMLPKLHQEVADNLKNNLPWNDGEEAKLLSEYQDQIPLLDFVFTNYEFHKADITSEVSYRHDFGSFFMVGRLDFRIVRHDETFILDGKNSKYGLKYLDENQLLWYSLLEQKVKGNLPDRLGFWLYRDGLLHFINWNEKSVLALEEQLCDFASVILQEKQQIAEVGLGDTVFKAKPANQSCRFCLFTKECSAHKAWEKEKKIKVSVPEIYGGCQEVDI